MRENERISGLLGKKWLCVFCQNTQKKMIIKTLVLLVIHVRVQQVGSNDRSTFPSLLLARIEASLFPSLGEQTLPS